LPSVPRLVLVPDCPQRSTHTQGGSFPPPTLNSTTPPLAQHTELDYTTTSTHTPCPPPAPLRPRRRLAREAPRCHVHKTWPDMPPPPSARQPFRKPRHKQLQRLPRQAIKSIRACPWALTRSNFMLQVGPPEEEEEEGGTCHPPHSQLVLLLVLVLASSSPRPPDLRHYHRSLLRLFRSHLCCLRGLQPCSPSVSWSLLLSSSSSTSTSTSPPSTLPPSLPPPILPSSPLLRWGACLHTSLLPSYPFLLRQHPTQEQQQQPHTNNP